MNISARRIGCLTIVALTLLFCEGRWGQCQTRYRTAYATYLGGSSNDAMNCSINVSRRRVNELTPMAFSKRDSVGWLAKSLS